MILPPLNTKGIFSFSPPFDREDITNKEYTVKSIRTLTEIHKNEGDPLHTIYLPHKLTEDDFNQDLQKDVPIIGFVDEGTRLIYIPANRVIGMPLISGVSYRQKVINIGLGLVPEDYALEGLVNNLKDVVMDALGVIPPIKISIHSATSLKTHEEHQEFLRRISSHPRAGAFQSNREKYNELLNNYRSLKENYDALTEFMISTWDNNVQFLTEIPQKVKDVMTKKIVINLVGSDPLQSFQLNKILFQVSGYIGSSLSPVYAKGFSVKDQTTRQSFYGVLGQVPIELNLTEGEIHDSHLPYIFSDHESLVFYPFDKKQDTGTKKVSRGSIEILLEKPLYITSLQAQLYHHDQSSVNQCRFIFYNDNNKIVYNSTFKKDRDFSPLSPLLMKNIKDALQIRNDIPHPLPDED